MEGIKFKADETLKGHLKSLGFKNHNVEGDKKYFVKKDKIQVRIDEKFGLIAFIDLKGIKIVEKSSTSPEEINSYIN